MTTKFTLVKVCFWVLGCYKIKKLLECLWVVGFYKNLKALGVLMGSFELCSLDCG